MLVENKDGNYFFLPSSRRYSAAVTAAPGYGIVRVVPKISRPLASGFDLINEHLQERGRPRAALCSLELRCPQSKSLENFAEFNETYSDLLNQWGIPTEPYNPVARTNVAPEHNKVQEPTIYAFAYTFPLAKGGAFDSFVVSGGGEIPEPNLTSQDIVRAGETSDDALCEKAAFVLQSMQGRLSAVSRSWAQVTTVHVYTVHDINPRLRNSLLKTLGDAAQNGITWYFARPPVEGIEFEMDLRGISEQLCI